MKCAGVTSSHRRAEHTREGIHRRLVSTADFDISDELLVRDVVRLFHGRTACHTEDDDKEMVLMRSTH